MESEKYKSFLAHTFEKDLDMKLIILYNDESDKEYKRMKSQVFYRKSFFFFSIISYHAIYDLLGKKFSDKHYIFGAFAV